MRLKGCDRPDRKETATIWGGTSGSRLSRRRPGGKNGSHFQALKARNRSPERVAVSQSFHFLARSTKTSVPWSPTLSSSPAPRCRRNPAWSSTRCRPCEGASMRDNDHERPLTMSLIASGREARRASGPPSARTRCPPARDGCGSVQAGPCDGHGAVMRMKRPAAWRQRKAGSAAPPGLAMPAYTDGNDSMI